MTLASPISNPNSKVIFATAHLDHDPANNSEGNLAALCQKCHNGYDTAATSIVPLVHPPRPY